MIKLFSILSLMLLSGFCGSKEPAKTALGGPYTAVLLTKTTNSKGADGNERSVIRMLYVCNKTVDSINVYTVDEGAVSISKGYSIAVVKGASYLVAKPVNSAEAADSIRIGFSEADHSVQINKNDRYYLSATYYTWLKQQVQTKHSVMAVLSLLDDNIGDYPITDALPLLLYPSQTVGDKHIVKAKVLTRRSQSDEITDTWNCSYHYNTSGKLDMVKAASGKEVRFSKNISYAGGSIAGIRLYQNIEDRQITERAITYNANNKLVLKYIDKIEETGKNSETNLSTTLSKRGLGDVKQMNLTQAEVLKLVK